MDKHMHINVVPKEEFCSLGTLKGKSIQAIILANAVC
jgi:hypothetical protein